MNADRAFNGSLRLKKKKSPPSLSRQTGLCSSRGDHKGCFASFLRGKLSEAHKNHAISRPFLIISFANGLDAVKSASLKG